MVQVIKDGRLGHEGKAQALLVEFEEKEHFWGVIPRRSSLREGGGGGGIVDVVDGEYEEVVLGRLRSK